MVIKFTGLGSEAAAFNTDELVYHVTNSIINGDHRQ